MEKSGAKNYRPLKPLILIIGSIFFVEFGLMIFLEKFLHLSNLSEFVEPLLDAGLLAIIIVPILYYFSFRPLTKELARREESEAKLKIFNLDIERESVEREKINKELKLKSEELEGQKKAILNVLEDVESEKGKIELLAKDLEKFKLAVSNASDHIVITDIDGMVLYANKGVERITGFPINEVLGKKAGSKLNWGGLMGLEIYQNLWRTIKTEKRTFVGEFKNRRKNGENYEVAASISPILDEQGNVLFFVGIERDITKEKQVDRAKTEFVSLASHQLKTPLTIIDWYIEMLTSGTNGKAKKFPARDKKYIEEIYKANRRMIELVNSLLNVSRLEFGNFMVEPSPVDVKELFRSIIADFTPRINKNGLKVSESYDPQINTFNVDYTLMRIILQNLISNAVKYTPDNGSIDLEIKKTNKDVLFKIADSGCCISPGDQSRIFTKFFRADNARKIDPDGNGLGLYMVKSILDYTGGKIWLESEQGKGTIFYFSLPLSGMKKREGEKKLSEINR